LQTQLAETLPPICGDRIQLQQMIVNLMSNAGKAISAVGVGLRELLISTAETESNVTRFAVRVRSGVAAASAELHKWPRSIYKHACGL
jgi:signal transduction histidine kinase